MDRALRITSHGCRRPGTPKDSGCQSGTAPIQVQRAAKTPVAEASSTSDGYQCFIELACRGAAAGDMVLTSLQLQQPICDGFHSAHRSIASAA